VGSEEISATGFRVFCAIESRENRFLSDVSKAYDCIANFMC
jgi:hypothetical protein